MESLSGARSLRRTGIDFAAVRMHGFTSLSLTAVKMRRGIARSSHANAAAADVGETCFEIDTHHGSNVCCELLSGFYQTDATTPIAAALARTRVSNARRGRRLANANAEPTNGDSES
jgi:hypothetical protein